jgi:enoyl-CoA hydratase/carnithine racemase
MHAAKELSMDDAVLYDVSGGVGTLVLNRPERHNALGAIELKAMVEAFDTVENDPEIRVLVVTGAGEKTFCAGAALEDLNSGQITPDYFQSVMSRLANLPIPTIAKINGNVFGGATELALSCDFRIGIEGGRLRVPAAAFGLCYPVAGIARFVERLGANTARRMLVASETLDAEELLRIGFLDYLVPRAKLDERTEELALHIAGLAPLSTRAMKELIVQAESGGIDEARARALATMCDESDDLQEGFAAQKEKRAPRFSGH